MAALPLRQVANWVSTFVACFKGFRSTIIDALRDWYRRIIPTPLIKRSHGLSTLPTELLLEIVKSLDGVSLRSLKYTDRRWYNVIDIGPANYWKFRRGIICYSTKRGWVGGMVNVDYSRGNHYWRDRDAELITPSAIIRTPTFATRIYHLSVPVLTSYVWFCLLHMIGFWQEDLTRITKNMYWKKLFYVPMCSGHQKAERPTFIMDRH